MTSPALGPVLDWAAGQRLSTPVYLFSKQAVLLALATLRSELNARISYAVKANTHPLMLATLRPGVDEYNVTNLDHLRLLIDDGVAADRIVFAHPVIDDAMAKAALTIGVTRFVVDDERGLAQLLSYGADLRFTLRLRPDHDGEEERSIVRFGASADSLTDLAVKVRKAGSRLEAISFYIGTAADGLDRALPYERALKQLADLLLRIRKAGADVDTVNIGGGFPGSRRRFHRDHPDFFAQIGEHLRSLEFSGTQVVCEPGCYLSEASMAMLTSVVADRSVGDRRMTYLDASGYGGLFETTFVDQGGTSLNVVTIKEGRRSITQLLGPIMNSFDIVKRDALLPPLASGDLLLLPSIGAYSLGHITATEGLRHPTVVALPDRLDRLISTSWQD